MYSFTSKKCWLVSVILCTVCASYKFVLSSEYSVLIGEPEEKSPLGKSTLRS